MRSSRKQSPRRQPQDGQEALVVEEVAEGRPPLQEPGTLGRGPAGVAEALDALLVGQVPGVDQLVEGGQLPGVEDVLDDQVAPQVEEVLLALEIILHGAAPRSRTKPAAAARRQREASPSRAPSPNESPLTSGPSAGRRRVPP